MEIFLQILLTSICIILAIGLYKIIQLERENGIFKDVKNKIDVEQKKFDNLTKEKQELQLEICRAKEQQQSAIDLAEKQLELEKTKRLTDFHKQLELEFKELEKQSNKHLLETELQNIRCELYEAKNNLDLYQASIKSKNEKENFESFHSIELNPTDIKDIQLIREFAPRLARQESLSKLIWTEIYQKPIQTLCKTLGAEKVTGIYKITNKQTDQMYIGQAIDIAARWKDHCKSGLGIGSLTHLINKFYKALHKEGIENFTFEIIEVCNKNELNAREKYWIEFYNSVSFGYNSKGGNGGI